VKLILSTAQPHGGLLPTLGTTYAEFYRPPPPPKMMTIEEDDEKYSTSNGGEYADLGPLMEVQTTEASEQILSSTFTIPQAKSIPADGSEHKVSNSNAHFQNVYNI
jgi:hypothetical protein